jgi:hypothetical protein
MLICAVEELKGIDPKKRLGRWGKDRPTVFILRTKKKLSIHQLRKSLNPGLILGT